MMVKNTLKRYQYRNKYCCFDMPSIHIANRSDGGVSTKFGKISIPMGWCDARDAIPFDWLVLHEVGHSMRKFSRLAYALSRFVLDAPRGWKRGPQTYRTPPERLWEHEEKTADDFADKCVGSK
jgi:hypothetical protein